MNIMYDVPGNPDIKEVLINDEVIKHGAKPMVSYKKQAG